MRGIRGWPSLSGIVASTWRPPQRRGKEQKEKHQRDKAIEQEQTELTEKSPGFPPPLPLLTPVTRFCFELVFSRNPWFNQTIDCNHGGHRCHGSTWQRGS